MALAPTVILAGDVGGTKTNLAAFELRHGVPVPIESDSYPSRESANFESLVVRFAKKVTRTKQVRIDHACFGIAGPVRGGRCEVTNLPWVVESDALSAALDISGVTLINDLEATAYAIPVLHPQEVEELSPGVPFSTGNLAVIAAGTGLGEAGAYWDGARHLPFASEGGHTDYAPRNELEVDLWRYLQGKFGRVSWQRLLSGVGQVNIYEFLRDTGRGKETPSVVEEMRREDPARIITTAGLEGRCALCAQALDIFVSLYGAEAGNLALKVNATGGVYLGGGIAPKILQKLREAGFMEAFRDKGRMRPLMESMPVRVIVNDRAALLGAACCAAIRAGLMAARS